MRYLIPVTLALAAFANTAIATPATAISGNCKSLKNTTQPFILVVPRGKELMHAITQCAVDAHLKAASINGLGAIDDPTIAYYNLKRSKYETREFKGMFELVSLVGDITRNNNKLFTHAHVALGTRNFNMFGGHLMSAKVGVTAEITFIPLAQTVERRYTKSVKLNTITP